VEKDEKEKQKKKKKRRGERGKERVLIWGSPKPYRVASPHPRRIASLGKHAESPPGEK
jgi:hypothetical protein